MEDDELQLDEAFALLDDFDIDNCTYESTTSSSDNSPLNTSSDTSTDSDATLLVLLRDLAPAGLAFPWDAARPTASSQFTHWDDLLRALSPPAVANQLERSQLNKKPLGRASAAAELAKRTRKKNKSEIFQLRQELEELNAQHSTLLMVHGEKRQRPTSTSAHRSSTALVASSAGSPQFMWLEIAMVQRNALKESESLNRRLRSAVAQQRKVITSMQAFFQKTVPHKELDLLLQAPAATSAHLRIPSSHELLLAHLHRSAESQYHKADLVCYRISRLSDTRMAFTICDTRVDAKHGRTYEITANVPVANDFRVVGRLMWSRSMENRDPLAMRSSTATNQFAHIVHEKRVEMPVPSSIYGMLRVDGVAVVCKFEEERRIVLTVAVSYTVSDTGIAIREAGWIVVSKADNTYIERRAGSAARTLFQTHHRIHSESEQESNSLSLSIIEQKQHVQELVLKALDNHQRVHMAELQRSLLSASESMVLNLMEFKCPVAECTC